MDPHRNHDGTMPVTLSAWKKLRRSPASDVSILDMLATSARLEMTRTDPDMGDVLALVLATGLTPDDAS